jgi:hypothetical protein
MRTKIGFGISGRLKHMRNAAGRVESEVWMGLCVGLVRLSLVLIVLGVLPLHRNCNVVQ